MFKKLTNLFGSNKNEGQTSAEESTVIQHNDAEKNDEVESEKNIYKEEGSYMELAPETLHGTNYTIEEFDAEVERRIKEITEDNRMEGYTLSEREVDNYRFNIRRDVYQEWTGADWDQTIQWEQMNSMQHTGIASFGNTKHDEANELLQPIHGISLEDYAAMCYKLAAGTQVDAIVRALGIDIAIWEEVNTLWAKRMQEDTTFTVVTLFGQYYGTAEQHPKLGNIEAETSDLGKENIEKLKSDRYFYEELAGARTAAYEYGLDGAQWMLDNYGVSLGDFQKIATMHMEADNKNFNSNLKMEYVNYQSAKQKEYAQKFAQEQGGNIADDIEF